MLLGFHKGFASVELLMALVIMMGAFKIFWKIYEENERYRFFSQENQKIFLAQKHISEKIYFNSTQETSKGFFVLSQKGFSYDGKLLEDYSEEGLGYHYFYPQKIRKNEE
ncbi:hypothetical protein [Helicobacter sp. 12S02232-10]|uniref:hypothetical protein n=1 Tax=Helicobacter sp. 12S02232-10 TaxID=1476197 RepID=UPI0015DF6ECE|nr:hypothetical protein [Helicobacter sp. 12S02232-10]